MERDTAEGLFLGEENWRNFLSRVIKGLLEKGKVDLEEQ